MDLKKKSLNFIFLFAILLINIQFVFALEDQSLTTINFDYPLDPSRFSVNYSEYSGTANFAYAWLTNLGIFNSANGTQHENINNDLTIKESWLSDFGNSRWLRWITDSPGLYNNSNTIFLNMTFVNETIEDKIRSIEYNASDFAVPTGAGTIDAGNLFSIQVADDDDWLNISEDSGVPPNMDLIVNFTGIANFNSIQFDILYDDGGGHQIAIGVWDCDGGEYEYEYQPNIVDMDNLARLSRNMLDPEKHICGVDKNVSVIFTHLNVGNANHNFHMDDIKLIQGASISSPVEVDPLAIHSSGDVPWMGNENGNGFNSTGWDFVNANNIFAQNTSIPSTPDVQLGWDIDNGFWRNTNNGDRVIALELDGTIVQRWVRTASEFFFDFENGNITNVDRVQANNVNTTNLFVESITSPTGIINFLETNFNGSGNLTTKGLGTFGNGTFPLIIGHNIGTAVDAIIGLNTGGSEEGEIYIGGFDYSGDVAYNVDTIFIRAVNIMMGDGGGTPSTASLVGHFETSSGSVTDPAYSFTGRTRDGMWSSAENVLNFATNGVERLELNGADSTFTTPVTATSFNVGGTSYSDENINSGSGSLDLFGDENITITSGNEYINLNSLETKIYSSLWVQDEITLDSDNNPLSIGGGQDLEIFHDGTDSQIFNNNGDLVLNNSLGSGEIILDGNVTTGNRFFLPNGGSIGDNSTCSFIFYNSSGQEISNLGCL